MQIASLAMDQPTSQVNVVEGGADVRHFQRNSNFHQRSTCLYSMGVPLCQNSGFLVMFIKPATFLETICSQKGIGLQKATFYKLVQLCW